MTTHYSIGKRFMSAILMLALLVTMLPAIGFAASAAELDSSIVNGTVADPGTAHTWETMMGSAADGNRYAGRVWVDKSVYTNGQTVTLNTRGETGSTFDVALESDEAFQIIFSALGSTMTTTETSSSIGPMDVVLVLDNSASMSQTSSGTTRLQKVVEAANSLLASLQNVKNVRIAIVTYNTDAQTILTLGSYTNGVTLQVDTYTESQGGRPGSNSDNGGKLTAYDNDGTALGDSSTGYQTGTNLQSGIDTGMKILNNAGDVTGRVPVMIVLTDGRADMAVNSSWYATENGTYQHPSSNDVTAGVALGTILNAAYMKSSVEDHYNKSVTVYGVGVDLSAGDEAVAVINPADATYGFNSNNTNSDISTAYGYYQSWAAGQNVSFTHNRITWTYNQLPEGSTVTRDDVISKINYVDTYYNVTAAELEGVFSQIYDEMTSGVFNPISSSTTVSGGTGVEETPLIFVDYIGQYMEIKEIQSVTLFGASYSVTNNGNGSYTVAAGTGINPTTGEEWSTSEDIRISVTTENGIQKLEIRIDQEILPILMEQVVSKTVGEVTTATITEFSYDPLRVYYTVGISSNILLANGKIDVSNLQGYSYIDDVNGTVSFYSNRFGVTNPAENGVISQGDAHVGFQPSLANRYYYHQANQGIFSAVTNADGSAVEWEEGLYGVQYAADAFNLTYMTYADYQTLQNSDQVYTYVSFYRPTADESDAANAAELVTYLVYTNWGDLKESVAFYDHNAKVFINYDATAGYVTGDVGYAADEANVSAMIQAYLAANPNADIKAMLGVGSLRTSRFHNMISEKTQNPTETATLRYAPEYTHEVAAEHNDNDVVVWLGNNGKLTVAIDTGIALTKNVTEAIGNADDTYAVTVTVPAGVTATPVVVDESGNDVTASISTYENNVLTVNLKAGQTVYISGIPGGTACAIGEVINGDYYIAAQTETVTVPTVSQVLSGAVQFAAAQVTNAPNKYGNLYITKEVEHSLGGEQFPADYEFEFQVTFKDKDGNLIKNTTFALENNYDASITELTTDENGVMYGKLRHGETVYIKNIPAGATVSVKEVNVPNGYTAAYESIDYSGAVADNDGDVTIYADRNATVVATNTYTPDQVSVDISFNGTKIFDASQMTVNSEFTFKLQEYVNGVWTDVNTKTVSVSAGENANKLFSFDSLNLSYGEPGVHSYRIVEVKGDNTHITYDRSVFTFSVNVTLDSKGNLVAEVVGHNTNGVFTVTGDSASGYAVTTVFTNYYHKTATSIEIIKTVNSDPANGQSPAGFVIESYEADADWNIGALIRSTTTDAQGKAMLVRNYDNTDFVNNDADGDGKVTYHFIIKEKNTGIAGWTYDETQYRVTVVLTKDATEAITADFSIVKVAADGTTTDLNVTGDTAQISFVNTYAPTTVTVDLDGQVAKELTGKTLEAGMFTFYVFNNGEVDRSDYTKALFSGTNDLNGNVQFVNFEGVLTFDKVGKYEYDIVEFIPEGELNGMSYDPTIYDLVVEVSLDAANGKLVANYYFEDAVGQVVTFHNYYKVATVSYQFGGLKTLNGRAMQAGEFTFQLLDSEKNLLQTATNKADGTFVFDPINYTAAGEYSYTICEVKGSAPGVNYTGADNPIEIKVTVTDTNGVLSAEASVANTAIRFENTYVADAVNVKFAAIKTLVGAMLDNGMFRFELYRTDNSFLIAADAAPVLIGTNDAAGAVALGSIPYTAPGTYFYTLIENAADPMDGYVYDRTEYHYMVSVRDVGNGKLEATVTCVSTNASASGNTLVDAPVAQFTNAAFDEVTEKEVYHAADTVTEIDGSQVQPGDILTYFITYTNYTGEDVVVDIMDTIPNHTTYVEGSASHGGTYAGTHVNWILNVARGESVTVSFNVTVDDVDAIVNNTAVVRDGVNTYTTNEVTNHTVEDQLEKDVFAPADPTVSIDGNKVYEGDELLYQIDFTNTTGAPVTITITDRIPEHTTYVEGSASSGGVYADGVITWTVEVAPWSAVSVSFRVTVNADVGAVTIKNQATATDGTNQYETDVVTNYTVDDEVSKEVYNAEAPEISIDGKKVYAGDTLVYAITYTNSAAEAVTITITDAIPQYTTYVAGSASNGGVYENGKITWNMEVGVGETVTVTFKVTVKNVANAKIANKATVIEGNNTYTTNETSNYTVRDEVEKDVFSAAKPGISIDGKKVYAGDTLVYAISYTNSADEAVAITITDAIPNQTTYVAGSASNGGVYENGKITWNMEVGVGETVTVTFKVTVKNVANAKIANKATVIEGKNVYITNETSNYTVRDEVEKDVFSAAKPGISIDGKKVYAGDTLVYAITYTNSAAEAVIIIVTDRIPEHTSYVPGSVSHGGVYENDSISWVVGVAAGETVTVTFQVTVNDVANAEISNKATIVEGKNVYVTNETSNHTVEDEVSKEVYNAEAPEISIDGKKVYAGDTLVYAISYTNGANEAVKITITDLIPNYTSYVSGSASNGGVYENGVITWNIEVAAGETVTVTFQVTVNDVANAEISNKATIVEGNNTYITNETSNYTVEDEVEKDVFNAEAPEISIDGKKVYAGDTLVYAISYTNGANEAVKITITDLIPNYTSYVSGSASNGGVYENGQITWNIEVAAGETVTVTFQVTVNDVANAEISNKATIVEGKNVYVTNETSNHTVEDEVSKEVYNAEAPEISIDGKKVYAGDTLVYAISYTNGANEAVKITITDLIPNYTSYVSGSASNGGVYENGQITWNIEVAAGETVTVTFQVTVNDVANAEISNKATVQEGKNVYVTNETSNHTVEDEVSKEVYNAEAPEISIDGKKVYAGDTLVYAISYTNGANEAVKITITDLIPNYTSYVSGSASNGGVYENGQITWNIEVAAGETVTVTFRVTVNDVANAEISNKATVQEGKNTYTTNKVTTFTEDGPPETGTSMHLALWIALMSISGGAVITLSFYGQKKKMQDDDE